MTVLTEGRHPGELILSEANGQRSRGQRHIWHPESFDSGVMLKDVAEVTDVPAHATPISAGEEASITCIAIYGATTISGDDADIAVLERDAEVNGEILTYPTGASGAQKLAAIAQLKTLGIIVR